MQGHPVRGDNRRSPVVRVYVGVYPDGLFLMQGYKVPFLPSVRLLAAVLHDVNLRRILLAAVGPHLVVSPVLRIDPWLEGDGTALDVWVDGHQLPAEAIHDFRLVQPFLYRPVHAARSRLHLAQRVVYQQLRGAQRLPCLLHRLQIDGLAGVVEHDEERRDKEYRHKPHHPQNNLRGQRVSRLCLRQSLHSTRNLCLWSFGTPTENRTRN